MICTIFRLKKRFSAFEKSGFRDKNRFCVKKRFPHDKTDSHV